MAKVAPWRRELLPSSFRGVGFEVPSRDRSGGRNTVVHEYPDGEEVYTEDLGQKAQRWSVEAYVWGGDYIKRRDALVKALRAPGAGEYVDHWGGRHWVMVSSWSLREEQAKGGWATFRLDLVESGMVKAQTIQGNTRASVLARASDVDVGLNTDFLGNLRLNGPAFITDSALGRLSAAGDAMGSISSTISGVGSGPLSSFQRALASYRSGLSSLISTPDILSARLRSLMGMFSGLSSHDSIATYRTNAALYDQAVSWTPTPGTTDNRLQAAANDRAIATLVARAALVEQVKASAAMDYTTADQAMTVRDDLQTRVDAQVGDIRPGAQPGVTTRHALRRLAAAMVADITRRGADRSRLTAYTPGASLPALVLAHRLYGDATRAPEIMARNPTIGNPLFVPGGRPLSVLADG